VALEKKLQQIIEGLAELKKAREDRLVHPEHRKIFREEKAKMTPSDPLADELTSQKGTSDVGIEMRRADKRNKGVISHGYARADKPEFHKEQAKKILQHNLKRIKEQSKPNLPKSEKIAKAAHHEDIVAGVKVPHELKTHSSFIPREHPHREIASDFIHKVRHRSPNDAKRLSEKYLNVDENGNDLPAPTQESYSAVKAEKPYVGPSVVSDPDMIDRDDHNHPATIQSPNTLTVHGDKLNNEQQAKRILRMAGKFKQSIGSKK
jgi:hypothetical protein